MPSHLWEVVFQSPFSKYFSGDWWVIPDEDAAGGGIDIGTRTGIDGGIDDGLDDDIDWYWWWGSWGLEDEDDGDVYSFWYLGNLYSDSTYPRPSLLLQDLFRGFCGWIPWRHPIRITFAIGCKFARPDEHLRNSANGLWNLSQIHLFWFKDGVADQKSSKEYFSEGNFIASEFNGASRIQIAEWWHDSR